METTTPTTGRSETREYLASQNRPTIRLLRNTRKQPTAANNQTFIQATPNLMARIITAVKRLAMAAIKAWNNRSTTVVLPITADTLAYEPGPGERKLIMNNRVVIISRPTPE